MKLVVHELVSEIYQTLTPDKNTMVEAIRPHIYKHGSPTGSLYLEIQNSSGDLIATSTAVTISSISVSDYFHGKLRFYVNGYLQKDVQYRIVLKATGYAFSESNYVGWCNSFDLDSYTSDYTKTDFNAPLALEVWSRKSR